MIYDHPEQYLAKAKTPAVLREECINYLFEDPQDVKLSKRQEEQIALTQYMFEQEQNYRTLFHMTITYKPYSDREYREKDVNVFFMNFYIKRFLPFVMKTRNYTTIAKKTIQQRPMRLHHHAILAIHPETLERMNSLIGENTLANDYFSPKIMTSDLKQCEPLRVMYASKLLKTYPEFLSFPDKYSRSRNKYIN